MNTLKPCPFCGGTKICTEKSINLNYCDNCSAESNVEHWNTRPIENALLARAEKAETMVKRLIGEIDKHISGDELTPVEAWYYGKLPALVTEWKESK